MTIHLRSTSQQRLVVALTTLSTIEIHMVSYKYTRKAFLQFPCTLAGKSPKWNILVVTWALVICLKYTHSHLGYALMLVRIFQANHSCPCYNYYIYIFYLGPGHIPTKYNHQWDNLQMGHVQTVHVQTVHDQHSVCGWKRCTYTVAHTVNIN